jgi:pimeloyl-ACP methyl ester carboxylesterase
MPIATWGDDGPAVLLVHGSVLGGELSWRAQRPLAERWRLLVPTRPSLVPGAPPETDFEPDSELIAGLLDEPAHLVGHSYGGVVSLLAAALRPEGVRSLTVVEPPAFGVARGQAPVERFLGPLMGVYRNPPEDPRDLLAAFYAIAGVPGRVPDELPEALLQGAEALRRERGPWEAEIPLDELAAATFPKLVVSGAHEPAFDAVCDRLEAALAADREVIPGAGHAPQRLADRFNPALEGFLLTAS